jgi:lactoylglutathione lyase
MLFNGLQHVGIPTDKFNESQEFYESLGFKLINSEVNEGTKVAFYQLDSFVLESWESETEAIGKPGAINHIALDTTNIEAAFERISEIGVEFVEKKINTLPYWEHGIKFFNFYGPNREIFEVCQINKD